MNWGLLANTLIVAVGAVVGSSILGGVVALWVLRLPAFYRRLILLLAGVTFVLPPFVVVNAWMDWWGPRGGASATAASALFSPGGVVALLALQYWPIACLLLTARWSQVPKAWLEMEPELRSFQLLRRLLWPLGGGGLLVASVTILVLALNQVSIPSLLQVKVVASEVWTRYATELDPGSAFLSAWPLLLLPLLLVGVFRRRVPLRLPAWDTTAPEIWQCRLGSGLGLALNVLGPLVLLLSLGLPLLQLTSSGRTWSEFLPAAFAGTLPLMNSVTSAASVATLCVLAGLAGQTFRLCGRQASHLGVDHAGRWVQAVLWFFFFLPGMLLAIGAIAVAQRLTLLPLYGTHTLVILALTLHYSAIAAFGTRWAFRQIDSGVLDSLAVMPMTRSDAWRRVLWPMLARSCAVTWYLVYLLVLWDVEIMTLLQVPGGETLALRIFNLLHYGHNDQVNALCLQLLCLAVAPGLLWSLVRLLGRGSARFSPRRIAPLPVTLLAILAFGWLAGCSPPAPSGSAVRPQGLFQRIEIRGERGTAAGQFNKPRSLTVDRDDNLYVVDMTGRVQKFTPDGRFLLLWQLPQTDLGKPKGMACDHEGNIVVVEPHYQRVNHFTPEGRLLRTWGNAGTNAGQLTLPRSIAVDPQGKAWLTEYTLVDRVQAFQLPKADRLLTFGSPGLGPGEFNRAEGIDLDSQHHVFVADSCNHRIQVFSADGRWLRSYGRAGHQAGELSYPYDIRVDREGHQFVCEFGNSRIQVFDAQDRPLETVGGYGSGAGEFSNPWSLALDSRGDLYVADSGNHRVQKLIRR